MARSVVTVGLLLGCAGARPSEAPVETPASALPIWDDVPSPHPPGATNPPAPQLLVTADGRCFKRWVSPMLPADARRDQLVPACPGTDPLLEDCGTEIACPERATALREGG